MRKLFLPQLQWAGVLRVWGIWVWPKADTWCSGGRENRAEGYSQSSAWCFFVDHPTPGPRVTQCDAFCYCLTQVRVGFSITKSILTDMILVSNNKYVILNRPLHVFGPQHFHWIIKAVDSNPCLKGKTHEPRVLLQVPLSFKNSIRNQAGN